jgi:hypothetical protein
MGQAGVAAGLLLLAGAGAAPLAALAALALLAALLLVATSLLKLAALAASLRRDACDRGADVFPARLPVISLLVPLFQERESRARCSHGSRPSTTRATSSTCASSSRTTTRGRAPR